MRALLATLALLVLAGCATPVEETGDAMPPDCLGPEQQVGPCLDETNQTGDAVGPASPATGGAP